MPITINGTSGISGVDGSASSPAIQGTDTNTGISFPAADTVAVNTGGSERSRVDSSGRLLVGTSTSTNHVQLEQKIAVVGVGSNTYTGACFTGYSGTTDTASPLLSFQRSRGTAEASFTEVVSGDRLGAIVFRGADGVGWSDAAWIAGEADGDWTTSGDTTDSPGRIVLATTADGASSPTERMRITQGGRVFVGKTAPGLGVFHVANQPGAFAALALSSTSASDTVAQFVSGTNADGSGGTSVGSINITSTATSYATSSDYRLKENVTAVTDGITRLQQLKPCTFNFIVEPDRTVDGFLAHEVQTVVPEAITGEKDAVDDEGNPVYQGIDQSKLVPLLTAALQEAVAKIEVLETKVAALEIR